VAPDVLKSAWAKRPIAIRDAQTRHSHRRRSQRLADQIAKFASTRLHAGILGMKDTQKHGAAFGTDISPPQRVHIAGDQCSATVHVAIRHDHAIEQRSPIVVGPAGAQKSSEFAVKRNDILVRAAETLSSSLKNLSSRPRWN